MGSARPAMVPKNVLKAEPASGTAPIMPDVKVNKDFLA